jgi:hypothetical protein
MSNKYMVWIGLSGLVKDWIGLVWIGLDWFGIAEIAEIVWIGLNDYG